MQVSAEFSKNRYLAGTLINMFSALIFINPEHYVTLLIFFITVLANQYFLYITVMGMLGELKYKFKIPAPVYGILKFVVIIFGFYYAMGRMVNKDLFLVSIYTFQLIILVLSIKRVMKKN